MTNTVPDTGENVALLSLPKKENTQYTYALENEPAFQKEKKCNPNSPVFWAVPHFLGASQYH